MPEQPIGSFAEDDGAGDGFSYKAMRWELRQLVKYRARRILEVDWSDFVYGSSDPTSWREKAVAHQRIARIAELLGETPVTEEIEFVRRQFSMFCDERDWRIFTKGSKEEWYEVSLEVFHEMLP